MNNVINIKEFDCKCSVTVNPLFQWDKGQVLEFADNFPDGTEVQFGICSTETINRTVLDNRVEIPDILLEGTDTIYAWVKLINSSSETTVKEIRIPIKERQKPADYIAPEDEPTFRSEMQAIMDVTKVIAQSVRDDADNGKFDGKNYVLTEADKEEIAGMVSGGGSGTGGTSNYNDLENKPKINGTELKGNVSLEDLGIVIPEIPEFPEIPEVDLSDRAKTWSGTTAPTSGPSNAYEGVKSGDLYTDETNNILYRAFVYTPKNAPYSIVVWSEVANKEDVVATFNGFALPNVSDVQSVRTAKKNDLYHCDTDHSVWVYAQNDANDNEPWKKIYPVKADGYSKAEVDQKIADTIGDINTVLASVVGGVE